MPIYEYKCDRCDEVFEVRQKFSDEPLREHEKCGGPVHRLLSAPAIQFKGSGWYITDYARANNSNSGSKAESKGESKTDSNGGKTSQSESKTATSESSSKSESKSESKS